MVDYKDYGQIVSDDCGGHIHIGKNYLTMEESWDNLGDIYGNLEKIIYIISNKSGGGPRYNVKKMAKPYSGALEKQINSKKVNNTKINREYFLQEVQGSSNFYGINLKHEDTIEFRLPNGTLDADTWIENINLLGGIVKSAEDIAIIQKKSQNERTQEEKDLLNNFQKIKQLGVSEQEKLEALLALVIPEEDRDIYRERYEVNSKLIISELDDMFTRKTAKGSIDMKQIGRKVFLGNDGVTGQEYRDGAAIIEKDLKEKTMTDR